MFKNHIHLIFILSLTWFSSASAANLADDLNKLIEWFPGNYDNQQQVNREIQDKLPPHLRHRHTNHTFAPVTITGIPGITLYAQQFQNFDPKDLYRQRIYSFGIDEEEQAIKLTIYTPRDPNQLTDSHLDPRKLLGLSENDFTLKPGCEVYWKYQQNQFNGYLKQNACNYFSKRFNTQVFLNETLILKPEALILDDTAVDKDGNAVFGAAEKGPTINVKQDL